MQRPRTKVHAGLKLQAEKRFPCTAGDIQPMSHLYQWRHVRRVKQPRQEKNAQSLCKEKNRQTRAHVFQNVGHGRLMSVQQRTARTMPTFCHAVIDA